MENLTTENGLQISTTSSLLAALEKSDVTPGRRNLAGTARLTSDASIIASAAMSKIETNFEQHKELFIFSQSDHKAMDALLSELYDASYVDISFLKELDDETLSNMLKSQQSKRSRAKGKVMTMDNYKNMMTAAVAENLLRIATDAPKSSGTKRTANNIAYTDEDLVEFANDQEKLRRELRNIQSKKSINKIKTDFDESSELWQALLLAESQLKERRTAIDATAKRPDPTKDALATMLADVDPSSMKATDLKALLAQIKEMA